MLDVLTILVFTTHASVALLVRGLALSRLQAWGGVVAIFAVSPLLSSLPLVEEYLHGGGFYVSPILALGIITLLTGYRAKNLGKNLGKNLVKSRARHPASPALLRSSAGLAVVFVCWCYP